MPSEVEARTDRRTQPDGEQPNRFWRPQRTAIGATGDQRAPVRYAGAMADLAATLAAIAADMARASDRGRVADYIGELARVSPAHFGLAVVTADGTEQAVGDADIPFSIQSVSKVFALTLALGRHGDRVWDRVGHEPSGNPFNSIVQLEAERGRPRNPFINAGAIAVTDLLAAHAGPAAGLAALLDLIRTAAGTAAIHVDPAVAASEAATGWRNAALANYLRSFGRITSTVECALDIYFRQCAIAMSCRQLARAGRYLMHGGVSAPGSPHPLASPDHTRQILSLMLTCGHYDASGAFAMRVGLPGKSGVGGGILAIAPGRASIAAWSPGLSAEGNSLLGTRALERLARTMGWNIFAGD